VPAYYLEDNRYDPARQLEESDWEDNSTERLMTAMNRLDDRSRDILTRRWLAEDKATLHELAAEYNISAERVRQLEKNAMDKIKASLLLPKFMLIA
jgi:RNA polymerase sigma-32 factor